MNILLMTCLLMAGDRGILPDRQLPLENNQANAYYEQQNYEEALKLYLDLYGRDSANGALAYNIANTYAMLGDMTKAQEFYQKAARSEHAEAKQRATFNMGNMALETNELQQAVKNYVDYLQANPDDPDAKRNLEIALRRLQQQQQQQQNQDQQQQQSQDQQQQQSQDQQQQQSQDQQQQDQQQQDQDQQQQQNQDQQQQQQSQDQQSQQEQQDQQSQQDQADQEQQGAQSEDQQKPEPQPEQDPENAQAEQAQQAEQNDSDIDENVKEQILKALAEREEQQQKEYQERKMGASKRRAKDW